MDSNEIPDDVFVGGSPDEDSGQCDFCGLKSESQGKDFWVSEVRNSVMTFAPSDWWACDDCAPNVIRRDWEAIVKRATENSDPKIREVFAEQIRRTLAQVDKTIEIIQ